VAGDQPAVLAVLVADVNRTLEELDRNVASAATELGSTGLSGAGADTVLARLAASSPHLADAVTIKPDGRIAAARPEEFAGIVGSPAGDQALVRAGIEGGGPVMSGVFRAVEGFDAVSLSHPVRGPDGAILGLVSVLVEPELLFADRVDRAVSGTTLAAWAMTPDGLVLYDADPGRIGRNVVTDPAYEGYPEFVATAERIGAEPAGSGSYTIAPPGGAAVKQEVAWATAGLHGAAWRVVVVRAG